MMKNKKSASALISDLKRKTRIFKTKQLNLNYFFYGFYKIINSRNRL